MNKMIYGLSEGFSHIKYATNATSPNLVVAKQVTSKFVSQDLVLQNYFESFSSDEQEAQESCPTILAANIVESTSIDIFLEEANLVSKFWAEKMDKEESLSEDDELVQTSRRSGRPPKARLKANKMTSKTGQSKKK